MVHRLRSAERAADGHSGSRGTGTGVGMCLVPIDMVLDIGGVIAPSYWMLHAGRRSCGVVCRSRSSCALPTPNIQQVLELCSYQRSASKSEMPDAVSSVLLAIALTTGRARGARARGWRNHRWSSPGGGDRQAQRQAARWPPLVTGRPGRSFFVELRFFCLFCKNLLHVILTPPGRTPTTPSTPQ
jgi:hypothetical protein